MAACTTFSGLLSRYLQLSDLVMINLISVIGASVEFGIGPSLSTTALSALTFDFFFIPPVFAFAPSDLKSGITLIVMIVVAGIISGLAEHARRQQRIARARELLARLHAPAQVQIGAGPDATSISGDGSRHRLSAQK